MAVVVVVVVDYTTEYIQHRINLLDYIIQRLGWNHKDQTILNANNKKKKKITLELKTDNDT